MSKLSPCAETVGNDVTTKVGIMARKYTRHPSRSFHYINASIAQIPEIYIGKLCCVVIFWLMNINIA